MARLRPGDVAGTLLEQFRPYHLQLLRHHAASHLRDMVLRGHHAVAQRTFHPHTVDAIMGLRHDLHQPHALFRGSHPNGVRPWRWTAERRPPTAVTPRHRLGDGILGSEELQEEPLIPGFAK